MMERHPLSGLWPDMAPDEYESLIDDIAANGVQQPVVTYEGMILDGWHRYQAATLLGIMPPMQPYTGADAVRFVISVNAMRRHMTAGQRAACIAACYEHRGRGNQPLPEEEPERAIRIESTVTVDSIRTATEIAQEAGVSPRTIEDVRTGERGGFGEAMRTGAISPSAAAATTRAQERDDEPVHRVSPMERLRAELSVATNELLSARAERDALQQELVFLKGEMSEYPHEREVVFNNLRAEVSELRASRDSLQVELRDLRGAHNAAVRRLKELGA